MPFEICIHIEVTVVTGPSKLNDVLSTNTCASPPDSPYKYVQTNPIPWHDIVSADSSEHFIAFLKNLSVLFAQPMYLIHISSVVTFPKEKRIISCRIQLSYHQC